MMAQLALSRLRGVITNLIKTETYEINGVAFVRTYSDENRYVVRDGISYDEACDPAEFERVYTEGDIIPQEDQTEEDGM